MKMKNLKILFIILLNILFIQNAWALKVDKVKVTGNEWTKEETIRNFAPELKDRSRDWSEDGLACETKRVRQRLEMTNWFYEVKIYIVSSKLGDDYKNVVIEVKEGFLNRYGGGPIYAAIGKENAGGNGEHYMAGLGLNLQYLSVGTKFLTDNVYLNGSIGNMPDSYFVYDYPDEDSRNKIDVDKKRQIMKLTQNIGAEIEIGYRINYDFKLSIKNKFTGIFDSDYKKITNINATGIKAELDKVSMDNDLLSGYNLSAEYNHIINFKSDNVSENIERYELQAKGYLPIANALCLVGRIKGATQCNKDLPNPLKLSIAGSDGIRSLTYEEMSGNGILQINSELRWKVYSTVLMDVFKFSLEPEIFYDAGKVFNDIGAISSSTSLSAYGTGIRVNFDAPVFVTLKIENGWDKDNRGTLLFSVSSVF